MRTLKGPALFIAQYVEEQGRFSTLDGIGSWAAELGFRALQIPTFFPRVFDVMRASASQAYCDEVLCILDQNNLALTELTSQRQGQLMAVHPAYDITLDAVAPEAVRGDPERRRAWADQQLRQSAQAARRLGVDRVVTFSGALLWPYLYPYPPLDRELVEAGFAELARRWRPILDHFDALGVDLCFELHPTEDLHDGATFERFLVAVDHHPRCRLLYDPSHLHLQHMDYLGFIDRYVDRISAFHVKDAEFIPSARTGVYGGYNDWPTRAGRFRSPGDGQIDFRSIVTRLTGAGFDGWATLEWECCFKNRFDGAREGAAFIRDLIISVTEDAFDAPMKAALSQDEIDRILGLGPETGRPS